MYYVEKIKQNELKSKRAASKEFLKATLFFDFKMNY